MVFLLARIVFPPRRIAFLFLIFALGVALFARRFQYRLLNAWEGGVANPDYHPSSFIPTTSLHIFSLVGVDTTHYRTYHIVLWCSGIIPSFSSLVFNRIRLMLFFEWWLSSMLHFVRIMSHLFSFWGQPRTFDAN